MPAVQDRGISREGSFRGGEGGSAAGLCPGFWWLSGYPWRSFWLAEALPQSSHDVLPLCICVQISLLRRTPIILDEGPTPLWHDLILNTYICDDLISILRDDHIHRHRAVGLQRPTSDDTTTWLGRLTPEPAESRNGESSPMSWDTDVEGPRGEGRLGEWMLGGPLEGEASHHLGFWMSPLPSLTLTQRARDQTANFPFHRHDQTHSEGLSPGCE